MLINTRRVVTEYRLVKYRTNWLSSNFKVQVTSWWWDHRNKSHSQYYGINSHHKTYISDFSHFENHENAVIYLTYLRYSVLWLYECWGGLCRQTDGRVLAVYNMGLMDHAVSERAVPVNDGRYHIVRFTRSAQNASLQLDLLSARPKRPTGL